MVTSLKAESLAYLYPQGRGEGALRGVSFEAKSGELLAIVGPNGAGKSTLLAVLRGLKRPTQGAVWLGRDNLLALSNKTRAKRIAYVPQTLHAPGDQRTRHFIEGGLYASISRWRGPSPSDMARVQEALSRFDLRAFESAPIAELSGGECQRALLARAFVQGGELLLVDEPTNSLDTIHQLRTFEALHTAATEGRTVVVVTHDLNLASQFADRVLLLKEGVTCALGTPEEVLRPAVLEPVYGCPLFAGERYAHFARGLRPFVLPWIGEER